MQLKTDVETELRWDPTVADAEHAAWAAPGVTQVVDHVKVSHF